jgi:hypothetical protein
MDVNREKSGRIKIKEVYPKAFDLASEERFEANLFFFFRILFAKILFGLFFCHPRFSHQRIGNIPDQLRSDE